MKMFDYIKQSIEYYIFIYQSVMILYIIFLEIRRYRGRNDPRRFTLYEESLLRGF
jgi:hypothetical protein